MTKPAPKQDHKPDNPAQYQRFVEMAREMGAEGDQEAFDKAFRKVAAGKPGRPEARAKKGGKAKKAGTSRA